MKKLIAVLFIFAIGLSLIPLRSFATDESIEVLPTMTTQSVTENRIWVGTFQIVWNEILENIVKAPIKFVGFNSKMATDLNKKEFTKNNIDISAYYTKSGIVSPKLKKEIEKGIKKKFHEKSDILDMFDFSYQPNKLFVYAMLKKDFQFLSAFDKLPQGYFGKNRKPVQYFGIKDNSNSKLYKNVHVMFYNNDKDFAVKLYTKGKDEVLLYRTNNNETFAKSFADINQKEKNYKGNKNFVKDDTLMIPNINLYKVANFGELEGHNIANTNFRIDKTIETVDFKMNNEGIKLKSEAAAMVRCTCLEPIRGRSFSFNDNFVIFLIEKGQKVPYFAMRVHDVVSINKTGRK